MDIKQGKKGGKNQSTNPTPNNTPQSAAPIHYPPTGSFTLGADFSGLGAKLSNLAEKSSSNEPLERRVKALKNLLDTQVTHEAKFREEVLALEAKYLELYKPIFEQRAAIVKGEKEPTEEEAEREDSDFEEGFSQLSLMAQEKGKEGKEGKGGKGGKDEKGIPDFWSMALRNHPLISEMMGEHDIPALSHLVDVRVSYSSDNMSFTLEFEFTENPYFSNRILTKTYHFLNEVGPHVEDVVYSSAEGCKIDWKAGKNLTVKIETRKQKNKATKKTRVVKKEVPQESFFRFFTPPTPSEEKEEEEEDEEGGDDGEYPGQDEEMELDFEIGENIKSKILPHAIDWYTGKALLHEPGLFDDDEDYPEDDDDDELDFEEEDDIPQQKPPRRR